MRAASVVLHHDLDLVSGDRHRHFRHRVWPDVDWDDGSDAGERIKARTYEIGAVLGVERALLSSDPLLR